jgi:hypothetical protein
MRRVVAAASRPARRRLRDPFAADAHARLLVHCSHHKAGTIWFQRVLLDVAAYFGLSYRTGHDLPRVPDEGIVHYRNTGEFEAQCAEYDGRAFRGSHLVRDPRDLVVSAYHYHLHTSEQWIRMPRDEYAGRSLQEHLRSLNEHDGLLEEIRFASATVLPRMASWDYGRPQFLELRYEDVFVREQEGFHHLFRWYGFSPEAATRALEIAQRRSTSSRRRPDPHVRSGRPGEWMEHFTRDHRVLFAELAGDLLVTLRYEPDAAWVDR